MTELSKCAATLLKKESTVTKVRYGIFGIFLYIFLVLVGGGMNPIFLFE